MVLGVNDKMSSKVVLSAAGVIGCLLGLLPASLFTVQSIRASSDHVKITASDEKMLFDFTTAAATVDNWIEQSDVVRSVGMSKAVLAIQKTSLFQRAIFFTLLNPQPNGAGFAGVRTYTNLDLHNYNSIQLYVRGQGNNSGYKVVLRHKNQDEEPNPTYEQVFVAPMNTFTIINLPLADFKPFYRGKELNSSEPLNTSSITNFGLQVYGGVYLPIKQSGTSSLEIDWIKAVK